MKAVPNELLGLDLLGLLMTDEEPLALMLADLANFGYAPDEPTAPMFEELERLERSGLVISRYWTPGEAREGGRPPTGEDRAREKVRLPTLAAARQTDQPHIGLWYRATARGMDVWRKHEGGSQEEDRWRLVEAADGHIDILAQDDRVARIAVAQWRMQHPDLLVGTQFRREEGVDFSLSDGSYIEGGVRISYPISRVHR